MWEITDFNDVPHKIIYVRKSGEGDKLSVEIRAVPLFFDVFDSLRIYEEYNEHMTAEECFSLIFNGSGFNYILNDFFYAVDWEGLGGGETRLEMFRRALDRYEAEFRLIGNTVILEKQVGSDTNFQYRYRLNASNIVQENDASEFYTYAKGYGDYEDSEESGWQNAKLIRDYTSPLAQIPGIGLRHAPPIKDGRITIPATMDAKLKELVDESLKVSISADIHDLKRQGFEDIPELGDRVFVIDERIGLDVEVRVVNISVTRNWRGEVIDYKLTFGTENLSKRYQAKLKTQVKEIDTKVDDKDTQLRKDLQLKSALPSSIVLNSSGIRATRGTNQYAQLDGSGLLIKGGAISIERPDGVVWMENGLVHQDFTIAGADPHRMDESNGPGGKFPAFYQMSGAGSFYSAFTGDIDGTEPYATDIRDANRGYTVNFQRYYFIHSARYFVVRFEPSTRTNGLTNLRVRLYRGSTLLYSRDFSQNEYGSEYSLIADLGVPTYVERNIDLRIGFINSWKIPNFDGMAFRVSRVYLTDVP